MLTGETQRTFDAALAEAFQITEAKPEVLELFPDHSIETFYSIQELREKIACYPTHPEERRAKAEAARVLAEHTWKHRAQRILEVVFG